MFVHIFLHVLFVCRPFSKEEMDKLYDLYAKMRHEKLKNYKTVDPWSTSGAKGDSVLVVEEQEFDEKNDGNSIEKRILGSPFLDLNAAVGLAGFLYSQLDILTALSVVANLEKRAQYDPQFRTSFPGFLRQNSWFL